MKITDRLRYIVKHVTAMAPHVKDTCDQAANVIEAKDVELRAARKLISDDLETYFDEDGERLKDFEDFDLTKHTAMLDNIDAVLKQ